MPQIIKSRQRSGVSTVFTNKAHWQTVTVTAQTARQLDNLGFQAAEDWELFAAEVENDEAMELSAAIGVAIEIGW